MCISSNNNKKKKKHKQKQTMKKKLQMHIRMQIKIFTWPLTDTCICISPYYQANGKIMDLNQYKREQNTKPTGYKQITNTLIKPI